MATGGEGKADKKGRKNSTKSKVVSNDGGCCICCEDMAIFAVGACDHPICYKCSARMRVLSKQTYCPTCRAEMKEVVLTFQEKKFSEFNLQNMKAKRGSGFFFEEWRLADAFDLLFENICSECGIKEKPFGKFEELRTHIRRVHEKQFCQICIDALAIFPCELKTYTKKEMVLHRKEGDGEDKSHRGHPECKFCNDRFVDNDTLLLHLRKSHFWCHFCEHDGKQEYYNIYKDLRSHFGEMHFLCDEGECRHEKFTSVFREQIDYQAHKLAAHAKNFNKVQAKEARKIEFDYSYRKRQPTSVVTGGDYAEVQSSEGRHPKGESSKHKRSGEDQKKLNFSNFEDVEKEREELREKKMLEEKSRSPKVNGRKTRDQTMGASAMAEQSEASIEYRDYRLSHNYRETNDDDVIGLPVHINRSEGGGSENVSMIQAKPKEKPKIERENSPKLKKVEHENSPKVKKIERDVTPKVAEDFPLLPGGVPSPDLRLPAKAKQEDFPALGKSVRPKETKAQVNQINHVAGIPVTVKTKKEKGKSWTQQSGRANLKSMNDNGNLKSMNDFPSLKSNEVNKNVEDVESNTKPATNVNKPATWKTERKPPGFEKHVNGERACANDKQQRTNATPASRGKGRGPPGLGAAGTRLKDAAAPGLPPGLPAVSSSNRSAASDPSENNIRERNMRLWTLLQTYLDDFNLQIFKNISGEFRKDMVSAAEYYSVISELLGDNLKYVFSELVALLPDECEKKRTELLKLNRDAKLKEKEKENAVSTAASNIPKRAIWGSNGSVPLQQSTNTKTVNDDETWCTDCGLTFPRDEIIKHMESHGEAFPSLPTAMKKTYNMPLNKKVHQSQVKNPWTK